MSEQRLIELETKISHQELAIEELQRTVYEQHKAISLLETKLDRLTKHVLGHDGDGPEIGPANEKPPHY